jgi:hypothetical protein
MSRKCSFFGMDGLEAFIQEMFQRDYEITRMKSWSGIDVMEYAGEKYGLDLTDANDVAYQSLNFEETWVEFTKGEAKQQVKFMLTGDKWCDVVPIADWTFQRNKIDVVKEINDELRPVFLKQWKDSRED